MSDDKRWYLKPEAQCNISAEEVRQLEASPERRAGEVTGTGTDSEGLYIAVGIFGLEGYHKIRCTFESQKLIINSILERWQFNTTMRADLECINKNGPGSFADRSKIK